MGRRTPLGPTPKLEASRMFGVCMTSFLALSDNDEVGLCSESPQTRWMSLGL
jgi:hypothetical protein